jgi:V/A-type H+-transporting ATPase subunit C
LSSDTHYAYAVSRIRAIERKMLDKQKFDRMIDAKTPEEALKVLTEAGYGFEDSEQGNVYDYERMLQEESKKVYALLQEIAPQPEMFDLFLILNDYHNIKVLLKGEFSGNLDESLLLDFSLIPPSELKIKLQERKWDDLPPTMKEAIEETIETYNRTSDPQVIDLILDKAAYAHMLKQAEASKNQFLVKLVKIKIDLANINAFLRVKFLKKSWDYLDKVLLAGGTIDKKIFMQNLQSPLESFVNELSRTPYDKLCQEGLGSLHSSKGITHFEKLTDNFVMEYVRKARYITLGIEPLVAYLKAKETEIKNARIIMVGKINNISGEIIRERLREAYV